MFSNSRGAEYQSLRFESSSISNNSSFDDSISDFPDRKANSLESAARRSHFPRSNLILCICVPLAGLVGFALGLIFAKEHQPSSRIEEINSVAAHIPLPITHREFTYSSPFSQRPPIGGDDVDAGAISEPIWDSLIPSMYVPFTTAFIFKSFY